MVGVIFPIAFTFCYFLLFDCLLVDLCFLFLFSCFSDSSLSIFVMVLLHHIIRYYITKLHYSRLLYFILSWLLFIIVFIILFSFHFIFLLVLLSPFKFYLILCCICCFISYLCYCIYYHYISLCIPRNLLNQKCGEKTNSFILFFL